MFPFPNKVVVGITGGIACGKSTVCKKFADLGWQVVSTDSLVHQLLEDDQEVIGQIVNRWGSSMKDVHGSIDKVQLAHVIFDTSTDRTWLERLLHPIVRERWMSLVQLSSYRKFVVEVPLLFENDLDALFTKTISVHTSSCKQIIRLQERGLDHDEITARINAQMPIEEKSDRAHFVIIGAGDLNFLDLQIKNFLTHL
jgi:dephospho-CoA kinase